MRTLLAALPLLVIPILATPAHAGGSVSVATFNIHYGVAGGANEGCLANALDRMIDDIRNTDADIVLLQEVDQNWIRSCCQDQPAAITAALPQYPHSRYEITLARGGSWCSASTVAHSGTMMLSKYPLAEYDARVLQAQSGGNVAAQKALVTVAGRTFAVYNTHFNGPAFGSTNQLIEATALRAYIDETAHHYDVIAGGDFNMRANHEAFIPSHFLPLTSRPLFGTANTSNIDDQVFSSWPSWGWRFDLAGASDHALRYFRWFWFDERWIPIGDNRTSSSTAHAVSGSATNRGRVFAFDDYGLKSVGKYTNDFWSRTASGLWADNLAVTTSMSGCDTIAYRNPNGWFIWGVELPQASGCQFNVATTTGATIDSAPALAAYARFTGLRGKFALWWQHYWAFARRADGKLMYSHFEATSPTATSWSAWTALPDGWLHTYAVPAAVSPSTNQVDIFVRSSDNAIHTRTFKTTYSDDTGSWGGVNASLSTGTWLSLGGVVTSDPAAATRGPGKVDVCAKGTDNGIWCNSFAGAWSGWRSCGGPPSGITGAPSIGVDGQDLIVYARDAAGDLFARRCN